MCNNDEVKEIKMLLEKWQRRIRAAHKAHYYDAGKLDNKQQAIGFFVTVLSAIVGSSIFASIGSEDANHYMKILTGFLSLLAVIFSALQTFLNYPEKRTSHLMASTQLSSLKKKIEGVLATESDLDKLKEFVNIIQNEWDSITKGAPLLSQKAYSKEVSSQLRQDDFEV